MKSRKSNRYILGIPGFESGSRCYKVAMKISKCAVSSKHIQDGRPGRYENRRRTKQRTNRSPRSQPKRLKRERNPVWSHIIQENVGRYPPESRCNLSLDLCKNSGNFLKIPEDVLVVNFIVINVFGRLVMKLDLAAPKFAYFRSNSANIMHFC